MTHHNVGVIGAGIHGASAAYHLAARGVDTIVFEREAPASGPTGRSSAVCRSFYTNEFLAGVAYESIGILERFAKLFEGADAGFRRTGALFIHPPADAARVALVAERLSAQGIPSQMVGLDEARAVAGALSLREDEAFVWEPHGGYADPSGVTHALFERAVALGATARLGTPVTAIELRSAGGATIYAGGGSGIACERVLVAAGPWTRPLLAGIGVDLPLTVERHVVATFGWSDADPVQAVVVDAAMGYYLKPEGEWLFCLGGLEPAAEADPDDYLAQITGGEVAHLAGALLERAPSFGAVESRGGWASLYDCSPDWQPVIGEVAPGVFVHAGTSGHGFKLGPALGRHVAALVLGDAVDPGLAQFHPRRFQEQTRLAAGFGRLRILG